MERDPPITHVSWLRSEIFGEIISKVSRPTRLKSRRRDYRVLNWMKTRYLRFKVNLFFMLRTNKSMSLINTQIGRLKRKRWLKLFFGIHSISMSTTITFLNALRIKSVINAHTKNYINTSSTLLSQILFVRRFFRVRVSLPLHRLTVYDRLWPFLTVLVQFLTI